ncbi:MAG: putative PEP-binding protein, partial [Polyangiales bacterium]
VGIMVEVPSAALMLDRLAPHADFFALGTNDLLQYTLAADRNHVSVAHLSSPLHPAFLRLLRQVSRDAAAQSRPLSLCGDMGSDLLCLPLLRGLQLSVLSVASAALPLVREAWTRIDVAQAERSLAAACMCDSAADVRVQVIHDFAATLAPLWREQGILLDATSALSTPP